MNSRSQNKANDVIRSRFVNFTGSCATMLPPYTMDHDEDHVARQSALSSLYGANLSGLDSALDSMFDTFSQKTALQSVVVNL